MALINACRHVLKPSLRIYAPAVCSFQKMVPFNTSADKHQETYMEKNARLNRPMSPHLSIYKLQITTVLSISHRATGLVLTGGLYALAIGTLVMPAPFPYYIEVLQEMHIATPVIFSLKFALAWSMFYHTANGIRHLVWDMGYGYDLKTLYSTGYAVVGVSLVASLIAAMM